MFITNIFRFSACNTIYYISKQLYNLRHLKSIVLLDTKWSWVATTLNPHYEGRISRIYEESFFTQNCIACCRRVHWCANILSQKYR
jgi:hypothetical protein